jgi:hypothetical protein
MIHATIVLQPQAFEKDESIQGNKNSISLGRAPGAYQGTKAALLIENCSIYFSVRL